MKPYRQINDDEKNVVREDAPLYNSREELEEARLRKAMNRTDTEKFYFLMTLMKTDNVMRKAKIYHKD